MKQFTRSLRHIRQPLTRNFANAGIKVPGIRGQMDLADATLVHAHVENGMGMKGQMMMQAAIFSAIMATFYFTGDRTAICFKYAAEQNAAQ